MLREVGMLEWIYYVRPEKLLIDQILKEGLESKYSFYKSNKENTIEGHQNH